MNFLSGQDDFFQTGNQPISVRHLSQPYNKTNYFRFPSRLCQTRFSIIPLPQISHSLFVIAGVISSPIKGKLPN